MKEIIKNWIDWSIITWSGLPLIIQIIILCVIFISSVVEGIKRSCFMSMPKVKRRAWIWRISMILGVACSIIGYKLTGDKIHIGYWIFISGLVGPLSNLLHYITLNIIWPWIINRFGPRNVKSN